MNSLLSIIIFINLFIDLDQRSSQVVAYNKLFRLKFGDFYTIDTVRKKNFNHFFLAEFIPFFDGFDSCFGLFRDNAGKERDGGY